MIWWEKKSVINHLCYHLSPSSSQFSMMISQLSLEMSIARKNAFVISQNEGCQIPGAPLYILSFQFSNKILSQFYIVLWTSRAMKLLSGTVTSCPDFHIRIHKKNNNATEDKKINTLNVRAKNSRFHRFYAKIQKITIFPAIDLWNL